MGRRTYPLMDEMLRLECNLCALALRSHQRIMIDALIHTFCADPLYPDATF